MKRRFFVMSTLAGIAAFYRTFPTFGLQKTVEPHLDELAEAKRLTGLAVPR